MNVEIVDEAGPGSGVARGDRTGLMGSRMTHETFDPETGVTKREQTSSTNVHDDTVVSGGARATSTLSDTARRMIAALDKSDGDKATGESAALAAARVVAQGAPAGTPAPPPGAASTAAPAPPAGVPAVVAPADELRTANERLLSQNQRLLSDLESARKTPAREVGAQQKTLDEAQQIYFDDPARAIRLFISTVLGASDHASKDVDAEMSGLYQDLTERELSVPLDPLTKATREAARTRQLLARDKRERTAETTRAAAPSPDDPEARQAAEMAQVIGTRLGTKNGEGRTLGERFPLSLALHERMSGDKPEAAIWNEIKRGIALGELDHKSPDDALIEQAATRLETRYQALVDLVDKARPQRSTAAPTTPTTATETQSGPPKQEARTITNASASVAPATLPATRAEETAKPKYRSEKERRAAIVARHSGS